MLIQTLLQSTVSLIRQCTRALCPTHKHTHTPSQWRLQKPLMHKKCIIMKLIALDLKTQALGFDSGFQCSREPPVSSEVYHMPSSEQLSNNRQTTGEYEVFSGAELHLVWSKYCLLAHKPPSASPQHVSLGWLASGFVASNTGIRPSQKRRTRQNKS